jgi:hypothetical protein
MKRGRFKETCFNILLITYYLFKIKIRIDDTFRQVFFIIVYLIANVFFRGGSDTAMRHTRSNTN